jgi:glycerol kinase
MVQQKTGLLLDPYFSGSKLAWLLDNVEGAREKAEAGKLPSAPIDSWLIWKLTGGKRHVTDATNAARTLLYNIREGRWDADILKLLNIPESLLPEVLDTGADFGMSRPRAVRRRDPDARRGGRPAGGDAGAGLLHAGHAEVDLRHRVLRASEHGRHAGRKPNRLLGTIAYQFDGKPTYALEGSIFIAGAVVQWLRDGLQIIKRPAEPAARGNGGRHPAGSISCPPSPASARPIGTPSAAARSSA